MRDARCRRCWARDLGLPALGVSLAVTLGVPGGPWSATSSAGSLEPARADSAAGQDLLPGQVIDTHSGRSVSVEDVAAAAASAQVVYLGEEHRNRYHIEAAIRLLDLLRAHGRSPRLALEMFAWDGQAALDTYLQEAGQPREEFLRAAHWEQNWGGPFDAYEPLVAYGRTHHLVVLALNPPRSLVRLVAKQGLQPALADPEMARWSMQDETFVDDPAYRTRILAQLRQCHGGLSDDAYARMHEASVFRDEGMARTIVTQLRGRDGEVGPVVSYTGGGHIQYGLPVPNRVRRRVGHALTTVTIYLTAYDPARAEDVEVLLQPDPIADYVWLTPVGQEGPPRRCG